MLASLSLYKLLRESSHDTYTTPRFTDEIQIDANICNGTERDEASSEFLCFLETIKQNRYSKNAEEIHSIFKD